MIIIIIITGRDTVVSMVTTVRGSNPGRGKKFFFSAKRPDRLWGPSTLLFNTCRGALPLAIRRQGFEADYPRHVGSKLRMSGSISPLTSHAFMMCKGAIYLLLLLLLLLMPFMQGIYTSVPETMFLGNTVLQTVLYLLFTVHITLVPM